MIDYEEAAQSITDSKPRETSSNRPSISIAFSLQILAHEGFSVKGDMTMQQTVVPQRASKPTTQQSGYNPSGDIEQEYDDNLTNTPRSAIRFRSTQAKQENTETKPRTTGPIVAPVTTKRVSGTTRLLLWIVLVLGVAFLVNGIVVPAIVSLNNQLHYGDAKIVTYDISGCHFITQEQDNKVRIVVSSADNQHNQVLVTPIGGVANHALVTLAPNGPKIEVMVNGTYIAVLVPDGNNGYKWGSN